MKKMSKANKAPNIILSTIAALFFFSGVCLGYDDGDFQYWSTATFSFDLNNDWKVDFSEEFRFGDDGGELYHYFSDLGFTYKSLAEWIDVGFNFRLIRERADSKSEWKTENRPHLNVSLKGKLFDLGITNRSRFEYRDREDSEDFWRYRNKTTIKFPFELTDFKLRPYVAEEIYVDMRGDNIINRNRFYSGFSFKLSKNLDSNIFYLWQTSKSGGEWKDLHILGTQLIFKF
jgi:hypothetical protein